LKIHLNIILPSSVPTAMCFIQILLCSTNTN
jgi:hypothetical protein